MRSNIALAAAAMPVALLGVEVALRVLDRMTAIDLFDARSARPTARRHASLDLADLIEPAASKDLVYQLRPATRGTFIGADVKIGVHGFRGRSVSTAPPPDAVRVVALGDSITFGWGVRESETFVAAIRRRFHDAHPDGPTLDVVNMGVPGYDTHQEVEAFLTRGLAFRPDVVVLFLCDNDDELPNFLRKHDPYTLRRSYLWDLVTERLRRLASVPPASTLERTTKRRATRSWRTHDAALAPAAYRHMVGTDAVERALRRLAAFCGRHGIPVVFAGTGGDLDARVRPVVRPLGFVVVDDLAERVEARLCRTGGGMESLQLSATDPHPDPEMHAIIGASLSGAIGQVVRQPTMARTSGLRYSPAW